MICLHFFKFKYSQRMKEKWLWWRNRSAKEPKFKLLTKRWAKLHKRSFLIRFFHFHRWATGAVGRWSLGNCPGRCNRRRCPAAGPVRIWVRRNRAAFAGPSANSATSIGKTPTGSGWAVPADVHPWRDASLPSLPCPDTASILSVHTTLSFESVFNLKNWFLNLMWLFPRRGFRNSRHRIFG